jgi:hypothetical protein
MQSSLACCIRRDRHRQFPAPELVFDHCCPGSYSPNRASASTLESTLFGVCYRKYFRVVALAAVPMMLSLLSTKLGSPCATPADGVAIGLAVQSILNIRGIRMASPLCAIAHGALGAQSLQMIYYRCRRHADEACRSCVEEIVQRRFGGWASHSCPRARLEIHFVPSRPPATGSRLVSLLP